MTGEKKKFLITGGAGFLGSHVVERCLSLGHEVLVIDDLSSGSRDHVPSPARLQVCDIRNREVEQHILHFAPDVLVHAAAQMSVRVSMQDPVFDSEVNVVGLMRILQCLRNLSQMPFFVFTSTGGAIYGEQDYSPAREDHPKRPTSVYGLAKYVSELYLDLWQRNFGLSFVALRLGNIYGPRQNPHGEAGVVAIFSKRLIAGESPTVFGDGLQTRDFIYIGDVVDAIMSAAEKHITGTFNIGTGIETNVNELLAAMQVAAGTSLPVNYAQAREGEQLRSVIDPSAAEKALHWQAKTKLVDGLQHTFTWYREA